MVDNEPTFVLEFSSIEFPSSQADVLYKDPLDATDHFDVKEEVEDIEETASDEQSLSHNSAEGTKCVWLDATTALLVSLVEQMSPKIGKTVPLHTKKKMWEAIRNRMVEEGFDFSVGQVESKYRALERQYKKTMDRNKLNGTNNTCPFQQQIETIMSNRRGTFPDFLFDHTSNLIKLDMLDPEPIEEQQSPPQQPTPVVAINKPTIPIVLSEEDSRSEAPKRKLSPAANILKELRESRAERHAFHAKVLQYLQKTDKRAERKEARDIRKLELLERLAHMK